jgi:adenylate cyclase
VPALLALAAGALVAGLAAFAALRLARARLAARFAQHLAPEVVARIAAEPGLLRIAGERRRMSFVFTDIEGFTGLVERMPAERLVALLDAYLAEAGEIAVRHGGVIDKVVGDALHVMFGAPLDQPDHAARALACAVALAAFGRRFAAEGEAAANGFGRTRVGVSTGEAVVGDVGGGRKLDYTAHGAAVNLAARLEAANKELGTDILADAATVEACPGRRVRRAAQLTLRGFAEPIATFTPWEESDPAALAAWAAAEAALARREAGAAAAALRAFLALRPEDALARTLLHRAEAERRAGTPACPGPAPEKPSPTCRARERGRRAGARRLSDGNRTTAARDGGVRPGRILLRLLRPPQGRARRSRWC